MNQPVIHLVCNAHIDPVWLWEWEEGLAETLSTFRIAADFCEKEDGFVFCHNEAILYQWVELFEPPLFLRIKQLVSEGKWAVIGGWYLQPDCNMPSGESILRQILLGKGYFNEKFGVKPTTAVNFDPFGHSRGLVQILKKSGYDAYLFCRPDAAHLDLPSDDFLWVGFDGLEILAHRSGEHYNSERGRAVEKIHSWMNNNPGRSPGMVLWGIGNHGEGPSREDLQKISNVQRSQTGWNIVHSHPDAYFAGLSDVQTALNRIDRDLNPWAVGCYTSMGRLKQKYRELESQYFLTERIVAHASMSEDFRYPRDEMREALEDLLFVQFHDVLPGSAIPAVEESALRRIGHGLEILSRCRTRAFFHLLEGHKPAGDGEFPVMVYNPLPYDIKEVIICEIQSPEPNFDPSVFLQPELFDDAGNRVECQLEKEQSNIRNDHRKRLVFEAPLQACSVNRFSCFLRKVPILEKENRKVSDDLEFVNNRRTLEIHRQTGLVNSYRVDKEDILRSGSARLLVMMDDPDPWGMKVNSFRNQVGSFRLMTPVESARFAGVPGTELAPVRVIEDGPVRRVVEALFTYLDSRAVVRYVIPASGDSWEMEIRLFWMEKDRMLKLSFATPWNEATAVGQVMYGVQEFNLPRQELVAQSWCGLNSADGESTLAIINNRTYGLDYEDGEIRISLLRSPAYAGHPIDDHTPITRDDRFEPRIDQGEHLFRFRISAGKTNQILACIDRQSQFWNEGLVSLCCYPSGIGMMLPAAVRLSDPRIRLAAMKKAEQGEQLITRLFNTVDQVIEAEVEWPLYQVVIKVRFNGYEIVSLALDPTTGNYSIVNLLEEDSNIWNR